MNHLPTDDDAAPNGHPGTEFGEGVLERAVKAVCGTPCAYPKCACGKSPSDVWKALDAARVAELQAGTRYLSRQLAEARSSMGKLGGRIEKADRAVRDLTKDRDHWRARARELEALVASSGLVDDRSAVDEQPVAR